MSILTRLLNELYWTRKRRVVVDIARQFGIYAKPEWNRRRTFAYCRDMLLLLDDEARAPRWACGCKANAHGSHAIGCQHPVPPEWVGT